MHFSFTTKLAVAVALFSNHVSCQLPPPARKPLNINCDHPKYFEWCNWYLPNDKQPNYLSELSYVIGNMTDVLPLTSSSVCMYLPPQSLYVYTLPFQLCAQVQYTIGVPNVTMSVVSSAMQALVAHGCQVCGSAPLFSGGNVYKGELSVFVSGLGYDPRTW
jgi:hypothetical protein